MSKHREYRFNNSLLIIKLGDIIETTTDVLVNSDDYMLPMIDGLSGYVLEKGGPEIKSDAIKKLPADLGEVVVTTAGHLPHKFIFHCVTVSPNSQFKLSANHSIEQMRVEMEEYTIRHCMTKCFRLLSVLDLESIAIPCIGVGRHEFSFERVGRIMSEVISEFLLKTNKSYRVELCLYKIPKKYEIMDYVAFCDQFALRVPTQKNSSLEVKNDEQPITPKDKDGVAANGYDVFISYSHKDRAVAEFICTILDRHNISHWIDHEGVHHGNDFKEEIVNAIISSKIMIFISSSSSNNSRHTIKEVSIAEKNNKIIIPIRIDDSSYNKSLEYDLCNKDWLQLNSLEKIGSLEQPLYDNLRFYLNRKE